MDVSGHLGHGLANSFHDGDQSIGTLISPEFTINHKHITFLIGAGAAKFHSLETYTIKSIWQP
jgi:levanase